MFPRRKKSEFVEHSVARQIGQPVFGVRTRLRRQDHDGLCHVPLMVVPVARQPDKSRIRVAQSVDDHMDLRGRAAALGNPVPLRLTGVQPEALFGDKEATRR